MKKKLWFKILVNFVAWWVGVTFIVVTENLLQYWDEPAVKQVIYWNAIVGTAAIIAVFSVCHYYILYVHFFLKRKYIQYVLLCLLFVVIIAALDGVILNGIPDGFKWLIDDFAHTFRIGFLRAAALYTPAAIFYSLIKGNLGLLKRKKELENQQLQSSIAILKSQLDPHFLFNSLNAIYATACSEHARKTSESIEELTGLFRYSLEEAGQQKVPVEKELMFIDKYLHLQKLRLPEQENIKIENHVYWDKQPAQIAPMLLLPFIENAYKYGVSYSHPSEVVIDIKIADGKANVIIRNTDHSGTVQASSTGVGTQNALRRLELQYKGSYEYIVDTQNGMYQVSLRIEL